MKTQAVVGTLLLGTLALLAGAATTFAITYTTLDDPLAPGATTEAHGISGGNIVGSYYDSSITRHGFLYNGSTYTTLDDPLGRETFPQGISGGNIVGYYFDSSFPGSDHGFLYNGSTYTKLDDPLAGPTGTYPYGISGDNIVGTYYDFSGSGAHGFLYNGSTFTTLDDPLAATGETNVYGISGNNIVGYYRDSSNAIHGFIYNGSTYTTLDDPLAAPNGNTILTGISGGNIVGNSTARSFLYNGSTYTTLDDLPGDVLGIDGNTIVGTYYDDDGNHGFVTTVPEPTSLALAAMGLLGSVIFARRRTAIVGSLRLDSLTLGTRAIWGIVALLLWPAAAHAIDFQFFYTDPAGQGFFNPIDGAQRRAAMQAAADNIGHLIAPSYGGETVNVRVTSAPDLGANVLANGKPAFYYDSFSSSSPLVPDTHYPKALANFLHGGDVDPGHDDIIVNVNTSQPFYYGTDGVVPGGKYDLVTVATHELIHGLGFLDSFRQQGGYGVFGDGTYDSNSGRSGLPTIFDRYVNLDNNGDNRVVALETDNRVAALTSNNLYWFGLNGRSGTSDGDFPQLFAPNPFQAGSTGGHTNIANDLMFPSTNPGASLKPSAVDRGILRDMGWDISVYAATVDWTPAGADNKASTLSNWSQEPHPGDALTFKNNAAGVFDVRMDLQLYQVERMTFTVVAPAYTLRFSSYTSYDFTGFGIENQGAVAHTFVLESHADQFSSINIGSAALMSFRNAATASNSIFEVHGGYRVPQHSPTDHYDQFDGAEIDFYNTATAASATFNIQGGAGDGANNTYGRVNFLNTASAGSAIINNQPGRQGQALSGQIVAGFGGRTVFYNSASANSATVNNIGQNAAYPGGSAGITNFHDTSTAGHATFHNQGATAAGFGIGVGGGTQFFDHSTAGTSTLFNEATTITYGGGNTYFGDDSTAGNAVIENQTAASSYGQGTTTFYVRSTAGNAVINNRGLSGGGNGGVSAVTMFHDDATAGFATIHNWGGPDTGGRTEFYERSTAGSAHIILEPGGSGGTILFQDSSNAGVAHLDASADGLYGSIIDFKSQSTAASAVIDLGSNVNGRFLRFWDNASAGSATINTGSNNTVQFYNNSTAANANITMGSNSSLTFNGSYSGPPTTTAANSIIFLVGGSGYGVGGSSAGFYNYSTAANAVIVVGGASADDGYASGATLAFGSGSDAGNAAIVVKASPFAGRPGGQLFFNGGTAPNAHINAEAGSFIYPIDNVGYFPGGTFIGSLAGAGTISLGANQLTFGGLGDSTAFSGPITGYGGSFTKIGAGVFTYSGASSNTGLTTVKEGTLSMNGTMTGPVEVKAGATLQGTGTFGGNVTVDAGGTLSPGNSPGLLTVGSLTLGSGSQFNVELGGTARGSQYDAVDSTGSVSLGGALNILLVNGFVPALGNSFDILHGGSESGAFSSVNLPALFSQMAWNTTKLYSTGVLTVIDGNYLPGDVDRDSHVTAADVSALMSALSDLSAYQSTHGPGGGALTNQQLLQVADFTNDNLVTNTDLQSLIVYLANNAGALPAPGGGSVAAVPEPAAVILMVLALPALALVSRPKSQSLIALPQTGNNVGTARLLDLRTALVRPSPRSQPSGPVWISWSVLCADRVYAVVCRSRYRPPAICVGVDRPAPT